MSVYIPYSTRLEVTILMGKNAARGTPRAGEVIILLKLIVAKPAIIKPIYPMVATCTVWSALGVGTVCVVDDIPTLHYNRICHAILCYTTLCLHRSRCLTSCTAAAPRTLARASRIIFLGLVHIQQKIRTRLYRWIDR